MLRPHLDDGELHLLVDVLFAELDVAQVLLGIEGKFAVFVWVDDAFAVAQAGDDALQSPINIKHDWNTTNIL